jgi:hypothetical protein
MGTHLLGYGDDFEEACMLEILATYTAEKPVVERRSDEVVRVIIHFGHTSIDVVDACREDLSFDELDEFVELWANPDRKRDYTDLEEGLLIRRLA